ncbi:MAG: acetylserotonin O-methyltransferase [Candidatus Bathyarchaeota archaeon]|nr:acetylserotonin O-methyltransferase [Candidatus Bathyarchaeota archaeon]
MKDADDLLNPPFPRSKAFSTLIMQSLEGFKRYNLITTAWESGLFDFTVTPKTYQEIAKELGYQEIMTQLFCDALVELGLLTKRADAYVNSPLADNYLKRSSSRCMSHTLQNMKRNANHWNQLATLLKDGPITRNRKDMFNGDWIVGIAEWAEAGSVFNVMKAVTKYLKVCRWKRLLDVGGGHGLYSIAFTAINPELEAFVFDRPTITPTTCKYIDDYTADRVHVISGDFYTDRIGECYDAIFSSFNQSCSDPELIPKLVDALNPTGDLVLRRFKDSSREQALKTLEWNFVTFDGKKLGSKPHSSRDVVNLAEYVKHLKAAGLNILDIVPVDEMSEIVFARKPSKKRSTK